jgi:ribonuclease Z
MSIIYKILGKPGKDNALFVWINSGTKMYRLLFDCGEGLLNGLKIQDVNSIDYLFFSHLHLDHAAGFDYFFRRNYDRSTKPVYVFGPEKTSGIIHHRLQGYIWNLVDNSPGVWNISDILNDEVTNFRFYSSEGFSKKHKLKTAPRKSIIFENDSFTVEAVILNHIIPSIGYRLTERDYLNIDKDKLEKSGLPAGIWLQQVKDFSIGGKDKVTIDNKTYTLNTLRKMLLRKHHGESIAYLTDFIYERNTLPELRRFLKKCGTLICESQYSQYDISLAKKNFHLTTRQAAKIAKSAGVTNLVLFHISERYKFDEDYKRLLEEAKEIFPNTTYPPEWSA